MRPPSREGMEAGQCREPESLEAILPGYQRLKCLGGSNLIDVYLCLINPRLIEEVFLMKRQQLLTSLLKSMQSGSYQELVKCL